MVERVISLAGEADVDGFRREARRCLAQGVEPVGVEWLVESRAEQGLFDTTKIPTRERDVSASKHAIDATVSVPSFVIPLFLKAALHSDRDRFNLLYRLMWRLVHEPSLRSDPLDSDRRLVEAMARDVRRDMHKMTAFVRFRPLPGEDGAPVHVAWFEPQNHIVEATAPFFARRFAQMKWAILTPECCVRWNGERLVYSSGANRSEAPPADASEQLWLTYYSSIFNPARLKLEMMQKEMPRRYWKNLPEASLIHSLSTAATQRSSAMIESSPDESPRRRPGSSIALAVAARPVVVHPAGSLAELRNATQQCRACPIGAHATQAVVGEGPERARLMLVGEQPGDREDLSGRPFVGPAGQLLDRALEQLGWPRDELYLTNVVRHFKYELRGKRRIHKTPSQQEVLACLHWLEREIELVKPQALIALGATAAGALLGYSVAVTAERGKWFTRNDGLRVLVTLHPSAVLRTAPCDQESEFNAWIRDLQQP